MTKELLFVTFGLLSLEYSRDVHTRDALTASEPSILIYSRSVLVTRRAPHSHCEDKAKDVQSTDYLQEPSLAAKLTQSPNPIQMI